MCAGNGPANLTQEKVSKHTNGPAPRGPYPTITFSFRIDCNNLDVYGANVNAYAPDSRAPQEAGWDFLGETANDTDDIWWILEGKDYPRLWWEPIPEN
ncbi:MAG: hypothetical protein ACYTEK_25230 [Planctomycetota bacterium]